MTELQHLQQYSIPSAKEVLRENYGNLNKVADYCESNYLQAENKRKALEETMDFTTQSLASVTYQISSLAAHILKVLDLQATKVRQVEANVCSIAQMVDIHKEKVARREIGELAVCKRLLHQQKVIPPASLEPLEPYFRKPLNFSILDSIGHGIKDATGTQLARTGTLTRKGSKTAAGQSPGTLGRSHRIPEPIQPPVIPKGKISAASSTSSLTSLSSLCGVTGSANTKLPPAPPTPPSLPTTLPPPLATDNMPPPPLATIDDMLLPPPPPPPSLFADMLPPPPASNEILPPDLPPPLSAPDPGFPDVPPDMIHFEDVTPLPPPPNMEELSWVPENYLEKVMTLYPYTQQKENELSFTEGAVIYVTRKYSDGWCEGVTGDTEGLFPGNYVEPFC